MFFDNLFFYKLNINTPPQALTTTTITTLEIKPRPSYVYRVSQKYNPVSGYTVITDK